jgi:NADH-quinone oxidoreductase subunit H
MELTHFIWLVTKAVLMIAVVMGCSAYAVLLERKVAAAIQWRPGPNRTQIPILGGLPIIGRILTRIGIFQPMADGLKFVFKEEPFPKHVNTFYFLLAPMVAFIPAMTTMTVMPFGVYTNEAGEAAPLVLANLDIGILFILAVSSLGVYGIVLGGWASNSKFPFLGGIRASAQMISYELAMGMALLPVLMWFGGSLNLFDIVQGQSAHMFKWTIIYQPLSAFIFLVALFAETNRLPFDMAESETDLVAGFNTEYGAFKFGLFFVGEYAHIIIGSGVFTLLFLGGWYPPFLTDAMPEGWIGSVLSVLIFFIKVLGLVFFFMWIRWTLPRFRYDQVMKLGWQRLLPLAIANLIAYAIIIALIAQIQN